MIRREHVLRAIEEYDDDGATAFLDTYGLAPAPEHPLSHRGSTYDTRAVVAVAYGYATGTALGDHELDAPDAAMLARGLGFTVDETGLPPLRFARAATVGRDHAHDTWALAARERLLEVAGTYHAVMTRHELADYVQRRSVIRTDQQPQAWIGDVLRRVAVACVAAREPLLPCLVIDDHGRVGTAYHHALRDLRGEDVEDVDEQASRERLECYAYFGATLPEGGGEPLVTVVAPAPRAKAASAPRARSIAGGGSTTPRVPRTPRAPAKPTPVVRQAAICPVHFIELPPSGVCDLCD